MWVQLRTCQRVPVQGLQRDFQPGDWVEVGRQTAMSWIATGDAWVPTFGATATAAAADVGVRVREGQADIGREHLKQLEGMSVTEGRIEIAYPRTVLWNTALAVNPGYVAIGLHLLETWEVAAPLCDYKTLAAQVGTDEERAETVRVIRDLRVPVYDTRLVFVRRCPGGHDLIQAWMEEWRGDERLAFLRALYRVKPLVLALPFTWAAGVPNV